MSNQSKVRRRYYKMRHPISNTPYHVFFIPAMTEPLYVAHPIACRHCTQARIGTTRCVHCRKMSRLVAELQQSVRLPKPDDDLVRDIPLNFISMDLDFIVEGH